MKRYVIGLTGASGMIYGIRCIDALLELGMEVHIIASHPAALVMEQELGWDLSKSVGDALKQHLRSNENVVMHNNEDIASPLASGSFLTEGMVIVPCSMATLSAIAKGGAHSLIERAADVMLKEKRPLIVMPRETPLSLIHLKNLLAAAEAGVHVVPAMPGFYHHPQQISDLADFMVGKVLDALKLPHQLYKRYERTHRPQTENAGWKATPE